MPNWKKVAISGSNVSQFNNDGTYIKMNGNTTNGLLTFEAADCATVESKATYNGTTQELNNHGKIVAFSGSQFSTASPPAGNGALVGFKSPLVGSPWSPISGSRNHSISATTRYTNFGSGNQCAATLGITAQKGVSDKNATVELTSIAKEDGCHDAIFSLAVKQDAGAGAGFHPVRELFRIDGRDETIFLSGSLSIKTSKMATTASAGNILVYDNSTGQIKKSSATINTGTAVNSVNGATGTVTTTQVLNGSTVLSGSFPSTSPGGASGNVQYNDGASGFAGEAAFTWNSTTDKLTVKNPGSGAGGLVTNNIEGGGSTLTISDGGNDQNMLLCVGDANINICNYGNNMVSMGDSSISICQQVKLPDLSLNAETHCIVKIHATTGELYCAAPSAGTTPTLDAVTTQGNTTTNGMCMTGQICVGDGSTSSPSIVFASDSSVGFSRPGTDCLRVIVGTSAQSLATFNTDGLNMCNGALSVGNISTSTTTGRIDASNDIVAYSTSDCRLKKYVKPIKNALDKIDKIRGVEFDWKVTDEKMKEEVHSFEGHDIGVIAQEVEEILPEVVATRDNGYKAVRYEKIVPLLIQGIKELKEEVEIIKSKI